jgi:hypothetical protein
MRNFVRCLWLLLPVHVLETKQLDTKVTSDHNLVVAFNNLEYSNGSNILK